jgi:hypothetical protein
MISHLYSILEKIKKKQAYKHQDSHKKGKKQFIEIIRACNKFLNNIKIQIIIKMKMIIMNLMNRAYIIIQQQVNLQISRKKERFYLQ